MRSFRFKVSGLKGWTCSFVYQGITIDFKYLNVLYWVQCAGNWLLNTAYCPCFIKHEWEQPFDGCSHSLLWRPKVHISARLRLLKLAVSSGFFNHLSQPKAFLLTCYSPTFQLSVRCFLRNTLPGRSSIKASFHSFFQSPEGFKTTHDPKTIFIRCSTFRKPKSPKVCRFFESTFKWTFYSPFFCWWTLQLNAAVRTSASTECRSFDL
jgi:hypothetical protein